MKIVSDLKRREWDLRRKLRLEQVRQQSNEIARDLRERVKHERLHQLQEHERRQLEEFQRWKNKQLSQLQKQYNLAFEDLGLGHHLVQHEPDVEKVRRQEELKNQLAAEKRGTIAREILEKKKIVEAERKKSPIKRKLLTRAVEDIRAQMIAHLPPLPPPNTETDLAQSPPLQNSIRLQSPSHSPLKSPRPKMNLHKDRILRDIQSNVSPRRRLFSPKSKIYSPKNSLALSNPSVQGQQSFSQRLKISPGKTKCLRSSSTDRSPQKTTISNLETVKCRRTVEFSDHPSRLMRIPQEKVERLVQTTGPSANEIAQIEEEEERIVRKIPILADEKRKKRGLAAIHKEKAERQYRELMKDLDVLSRKEMKLKTGQKNICNEIFYDDNRQKEYEQRRQRHMDAAFENIYHPSLIMEVDNEETELPEYYQSPCTDSIPEVNVADIGQQQQQEELEKIKNQIHKQKLLIKHVKQNLKEKKSDDSWESESETSEKENEKRRIFKKKKKKKVVMSGSGSDLDSIKVTVDVHKQKYSTHNDRSPKKSLLTMKHDISNNSNVYSHSTSYQSPPSGIRTGRDLEPDTTDETLEHTTPSAKGTNKPHKTKIATFKINPDLLYYINKALHMSRSKIAELDVSSVTEISTPNVSDLERNLIKMGFKDHLEECKLWKDQFQRLDLSSSSSSSSFFFNSPPSSSRYQFQSSPKQQGEILKRNSKRYYQINSPVLESPGKRSPRRNSQFQQQEDISGSSRYYSPIGSTRQPKMHKEIEKTSPRCYQSGTLGQSHQQQKDVYKRSPRRFYQISTDHKSPREKPYLSPQIEKSNESSSNSSPSPGNISFEERARQKKKKILEISDKIEKLRKEKELLSNSSGTYSSSNGTNKPEKCEEMDRDLSANIDKSPVLNNLKVVYEYGKQIVKKIDEVQRLTRDSADGLLQAKEITENLKQFSKSQYSSPPPLDDSIETGRYVPPHVLPSHLSTIIEVDSQQLSPTHSSLESFPNVEQELRNRNIPLYAEQNSPLIFQDILRNNIDKFRAQLAQYSPRDDHAHLELDLDKLGVTWGNSFLKKTRESKALSSNSDVSFS